MYGDYVESGSSEGPALRAQPLAGSTARYLLGAFQSLTVFPINEKKFLSSWN